MNKYKRGQIFEKILEVMMSGFALSFVMILLFGFFCFVFKTKLMVDIFYFFCGICLALGFVGLVWMAIGVILKAFRLL